MNDVLLFVAALANFAIFAGYLFVAAFIAPELKLEKRRTRLGGIVFFATCGLTHLDIAFHAITQTPITVDDLSSWWHLAVHVPQAISVWFFVTGIYSEIMRGTLRWPIMIRSKDK